jgi:hypothetical protein
MQDFPRLLPPTAAVGFSQFERWLCFSAVKNNLLDAALKASQRRVLRSAVSWVFRG